MLVSPVEQELYRKCCEAWQDSAKADPDNVYHRALKEIERLRLASHWATGSPAEFPGASPRPWGLYQSDAEGLKILCQEPYHSVLSASDPVRQAQNLELIVRAVNNYR